MSDTTINNTPSINPVKRTYIPGSEWLYFKIYTGIRSADRILTELLYPFVQHLKNEKNISRYFFIRYNDPDFHIRFRIKLSSRDCFNPVFNLFHTYASKYIENGLIWKIQCDTYHRELERYGTNTIEHIENIFFIDSENTIHFLNELSNLANADEKRWLFALRTIDQTLDSFHLDTQEKYEFIEKFSKNFCHEFGLISGDQLKQLNDKFRIKRKIIQQIIEGNEKTIEKIIAQRKTSLHPSVTYLLECQKQETLETPLENLVRSILHMSMNRLFRARNRLCETTVYYLLMKHYKSSIAQNKH